MSNESVLDKGLKKGLQMIEDTIISSLRESCQALLREVMAHRNFLGFTGQTQTSYMAGLYVNGRLKVLFNERNWLQPPRRAKVPLDKCVWLDNPYEGEERSVWGREDIVDPSGTSLSTKILQEYKAPDKGWAIVVTTGTEYSLLLEQARHLDVLTDTYMAAAEILKNNWKKLPD